VRQADIGVVDAAERKEILNRYMDHSRRFEAAAARRSNGNAEVIPFVAPMRELEQEPTMREIEVLQLVADGLVNREIGQRLFLSEETVKSHVRHLLAKLQARSRAHAVAVGYRRGIIAYSAKPQYGPEKRTAPRVAYLEGRIEFLAAM
jgi:DNA-binding NarL/FixJ family response regulator